jgi:hypothetical protein
VRRTTRGLLALLLLGAAVACGEVLTIEDGADGGPAPQADATPADTGVGEGESDGSLDAGPTDAAEVDADPWVAYAARCNPRPVLGSFAIHNGKVNVHTTDAGWAVDDDCSSGNNHFDLAYCRKFWDASELVLELSIPDSVSKPFKSAYCSDLYEHRGEKQFVCCGAL